MTELKEEIVKKHKLTDSNFSLPPAPYHLTLYRAAYLKDISVFKGYDNEEHNPDHTEDWSVIDDVMRIEEPIVITCPVRHEFRWSDGRLHTIYRGEQ